MHVRPGKSLPRCLHLFYSVLPALSITLILGVLACRPAAAKDEKEAEKPPAETPPCAMSFTDVRAADYFYEPVRNLYCAAAINGYGDNTFRPYNPTTRGQLSKIIVVAEGFPINTTGGPHFADVPASNPFYSYVETAYLRGVMSGYGDGTFRPNASTTRGQIAKVVVVANGWPLENPSRPTFRDVSANNLFYRYVETALAHSVVSGYADGTFRLNNTATRGQICKIIYAANNPFGPTAEEQQTVDLINARRAAMGRGALRINAALTSAARRHSNDIGPRGLCRHNGTDGSTPWERMAQAGYTGSAIGEVVGCGYDSPQAVVDAWWNSPGHYAILADPNANDIGCGWWRATTGAGWQTCDTGRR